MGEYQYAKKSLAGFSGVTGHDKYSLERKNGKTGNLILSKKRPSCNYHWSGFTQNCLKKEG